MHTIILSGVGGSTNWLPLILPLIAIIIILQSSHYIIGWVKKRRLAHHGKEVRQDTLFDNDTQAGNNS